MLLCGVMTKLEVATFYFQFRHHSSRLSRFLHAKLLLVRGYCHLLKMVHPCLLLNPFPNVHIAAEHTASAERKQH